MKINWKSVLLASAAALVTTALALQAQVPGINSTLATVFTIVYEASTSKPTYSSSAVFTPGSSADDVCTIAGSATKTVRVRRLLVQGVTAVAITDPVSIVKRSANSTGGTSVLGTKVPYDSTQSAATAVIETYTSSTAVNYSPGTVVGVLIDRLMFWGNYTTTAPLAISFDFGQFGSAAFLRGAAQQIAFNLGQLSYDSAAKLSCTWEWTEDNDF